MELQQPGSASGNLARVLRWWPTALAVVGLAVGGVGWGLYDSIAADPDGYSHCRAHAMYADLIHGTGDLSHCTAQQPRLYLSLA